MTVERQTILLVEDEESYIEALTIGLERENFNVEVATDGADALDRYERLNPDLILLDVMLPKISGIDVCKQIRKRSSVPIIMVSAKSGEIDMVVGLEMGADDYVSKPYRMRELVARMRAVMRRQDVRHVDEEENEAVSVGAVTLDRNRHTVSVDGTSMKLPLREFELLDLLLSNAGRVMTRDKLIDLLWGLDYHGDTKTLDVHIKRLRAKIEPDPSSPTRITTIRGLGYKFERALVPD
jgi:two-component system response regulator RegX3